MSRPIKFRAWDGKKMYFGHGCFTDQSDRKWLVCDDNIFPPQAYIQGKLMQFTGLTDKNGKEIYEGDIVASGALNARAEVRYGNAHFFIVGGTAAQPLLRAGWELSPSADEVAVIGNIYENPELLSV